MSVTAPTPITALGTPPSTSDPANFDTRADALFTQLPTTVTEINAIGTNVYNNALDAQTNAAQVAIDKAAVAANSAAVAGYASAAPWVSGTTYALGTVVYGPTDRRLYRRIVAGAGTTDPSADPTNWQAVNTMPPVVLVPATTQTAASGFLYALTNVAATTVTLPASPVSGDFVKVKVCNGLSTNIINPNGATIEGVAGNLTLDNAYACVTLQYINSSWRTV